MNDITLARRDLQDAHRLATRAFGDLRRSGASEELLGALWQASHNMGRALAMITKAVELDRTHGCLNQQKGQAPAKQVPSGNDEGFPYRRNYER